MIDLGDSVRFIITVEARNDAVIYERILQDFIKNSVSSVWSAGISSAYYSIKLSLAKV